MIHVVLNLYCWSDKLPTYCTAAETSELPPDPRPPQPSALPVLRSYHGSAPVFNLHSGSDVLATLSTRG
ncbi:hypothetical protein VTI28DRAFT_9280 [Corynascus sepedonium]